MLWVLAASLPIGALIGIVGIGGLLLPALLGQVSGDPHLAAGTSSWVFLFTGVVALVGLLREGHLDRRMALPLAAGAAPGAALGALTGGVLPGWVLVVVLALVCLVSGLYHLLTRTPPGDRTRLPAPVMLGVSAVVGFGSALTGTGGPVLLVPALLALGLGMHQTVTLALFSQVPIVSFAVAGYAVHGDIDYAWGSAFGVVAAIGALLGMAVGRRTHPARLRALAAGILVATGVYLGGSLLWS